MKLRHILPLPLALTGAFGVAVAAANFLPFPVAALVVLGSSGILGYIAGEVTFRQ